VSTTPPEQPQRPMYGRGMNIQGTMPIPGNAELLIYVLATILVAIIALASDSVNSGAFVTAYTAITFAYLLSRGIAKASRVFEQ
jgi:hypothetical protein